MASKKLSTPAEVKSFTPSEIAEATGADPKRIRQYLRENYTREASMKGKSWSFNSEVAEDLITQFSPQPEEETEEAAS